VSSLSLRGRHDADDAELCTHVVGVVSSLSLRGRIRHDADADKVDVCAHVVGVVSSSPRHGHMGPRRRRRIAVAATWPNVSASLPWPGHMGPRRHCCVANTMLTTRLSRPMCPRRRCRVIRLAGGGAAAKSVHRHLKLASQSARGMGPMGGDDSLRDPGNREETEPLARDLGPG